VVDVEIEGVAIVVAAVVVMASFQILPSSGQWMVSD